jgi:hypothetical protein
MAGKPVFKKGAGLNEIGLLGARKVPGAYTQYVE